MSPNPIDNPELVAQVLLSGRRLPGFVQKISGAKLQYKWDVQAGTSSSGATTIFKGRQVAESIEILTRCNTGAQWAECEAWRDYVAPLHDSDKPPTFVVDNILINFCKVNRVSLAEVVMPDVRPDLAFDVTWKFTEYRPSSKTNTGPANPATYKNAAPKAQSQVDDEIDKATKQAAGGSA